MKGPDHAIEKGADGSFTVKVERSVAGFIPEDAECPRQRVVEYPDGLFVDWHLNRERAAAFLAAWFAARDEE